MGRSACRASSRVGTATGRMEVGWRVGASEGSAQRDQDVAGDKRVAPGLRARGSPFRQWEDLKVHGEEKAKGDLETRNRALITATVLQNEGATL